MMLMILEIALFTFIGISNLDRYAIVLAQTNIEEAIAEPGRSPIASGGGRSPIAQSEIYNAENITQVRQLRDLSPGDWSYEAIRSLAEKYGCMKGISNRTFQGNRSITRYEFAAGLNSCLEKIEDLVDIYFDLPQYIPEEQLHFFNGSYLPLL